MTIWFTSDPHWGHRLVAGLRGFDTPEEHDGWLHDVYAAAFRPGDVVWWLGDLTARLKTTAAAATCLSTQPEAHHRLVYGNHDAGHPMHRATHRVRDAYGGFGLAEPFARRRLAGQDVYLSHFPYAGDHTTQDRYTQFRLPDRGAPLIHGHTHGPEKVTRTQAGTLQIHVGIDAWRRPVPEHEIVDLIKENS